MTELRWDGKYDPTTGKKCAPLKIALPFQTVETVNESAQERQKALDMFGAGDVSDWRNRLIWGDKKYVLPSLLPEFAGKVDLIYIDPPFDTGANFSFTATIPEAPESLSIKKGFRTPAALATDDEGADEGDLSEVGGAAVQTFTKEPSIIEQKAYRDTWGKGLDSYLKWFYETTVLLRDLLSEKGSIYVHCDWRLNSYIKVVLDEVFGYDNFLNEIIWQSAVGDTSSKNRKFIKSHDSISAYTKTSSYTWNDSFQAYGDNSDKIYKFQDARGKYQLGPCDNPGGGGYTYDWLWTWHHC